MQERWVFYSNAPLFPYRGGCYDTRAGAQDNHPQGLWLHLGTGSQ